MANDKNFIVKNGLIVGGNITTNVSTLDLINTNATTINAFGQATSISLGSSEGSTVVNNSLTVTGNLIVNGTTVTVNSTITTLDDPVITLGRDTAPSVDDNKDRGIEFRWHNGTSAKVGFFGFDDSTGHFTFIPDATNTSEVFSGTPGTLDVTSITGTASAWTTGRTITLTGDVTGVSESWDGSSNISFATTIAANSVALGTDTTGNYVATIAAGTPGVQSGTSGLTISATAGEGTAATIAHADTSTQLSVTNSGRSYIQSITLDDFGHITAMSSATETVTDTTYTISTESGPDSYSEIIRLTAGGGGSGTDDIILAVGTTGSTYGLTISEINDTITFSHADTSTLTGSQGSAGIASITVDEMGHVTAVTTATYLTSQANNFSTVSITHTDSGYTWGSAGENTDQTAESATDTITIVRGLTGTTAGIDLFASTVSGTDAIKIAHADTSTLTGSQGSAGIASITVDEMGHVTAVTTATYLTSQSSDFKTVTVTDTDSGYTWSETGSAVADATGDTLTLVSGTGINIDVDATSDAIRITNTFAESDTLSSVTGRGATTSTAISITNSTNSTSTGSGALTVTGGVGIGGDLFVGGGDISAGNVATVLLGGNTTTNISFANALTSGTLIVGGTATTGTMTIDPSTSAHTLNIATGVNTSGTKTVNIATGSSTTGVTALSLGSTNSTSSTIIQSGSGKVRFNIGAVTLYLPTADGSAGQVLKTDGAGNLSFASVDSLSGGIANVVEDTSPQLGGSLDVNGFSIVSAVGSNGNILITPDGTGYIQLDGLKWPTADGSNGYLLSTDGAGQLSWTAAGSNTTYTISAETATNAVLRLTGSDASTDDVAFVGSGIVSVTRTDANTITITGTEADTLSSVTGRGATTSTAISITNSTNSTSSTTGALIVTGGVGIGGDLFVGGGDISAGNVATTLLGGNTTTNISFANALTSGTLTVGGTSQTGAITIGRSTVAQTLNIATGSNTSGVTKTVNIGTGGVSGSTTAINIGSSTSGATNTVNIYGDLTVTGNTTFVNTTTLNVGDNIITLNADETGVPSQNAGIEIERGTSTNTLLIWNETSDRWTFTNDGSTYYNIPISSEYSVPNNGQLTLAVSGVGLSGSATFTANQLSDTTFTVTSNATNLNTGDTIVARDASGNFSAGTITAALNGNASTATTATTLATARNFSITGDITASAISFDGSGAVALNAAITSNSIVNADINTSAAIADTKLATISTSGKVLNSATTATDANTASAIVARDASGNFSAGTITAALSGNASTASAWATGRTITLTGDVTGVSGSWDGSSNISFATTIAANSVALGTDTTGNYVAGVTQGTGISVTGTAGEGWSPTIAIDSTVATLSGTQSLTNKTYSGTISSMSGPVNSLNISGYTNTTAVIASSLSSAGFVAQPFSSEIWHDLFAFSKAYTTTYETYNGTSWSSATLNKNLFAQKKSQSITVCDGSAITAARWTFSGTSWGTGQWLVIGHAYQTPANSKTVLVESSADGTTWTTRHTSTYADITTSVFHRLDSYSGDSYLRLTVTWNSGGPVNLSNIKLLTNRPGDQGRGPEFHYPYSWDADQHITTGGNLIVTGNLSVNGTITTVNSTTVTVDDPIITLGGDTAPSSDDNKDRGIEFRWHNGSAAKVGFFGFDDSTGQFTFIPDATNTSEVFSGTKGILDVASITGSAASWTTARTITLGGDLTGNVSIDGSDNVTLTATIASNSVALGTDTTGNYVATVAAGTPGVQSGTSGLTISATAGEGTAATIAHADTSSVANLTATSRTYVTGLTFDTFGHVTAYTTGSETVTDTDTTYTISTEAGGDIYSEVIRLTAGGSGSGTDDIILAVGATGSTYGLTIAESGDTITFAHADTSTLTGAQGSAGIASITVDEMGHVTAVTTATYLTSQANNFATVAIGADAGYTWGTANTNTNQTADSATDTITIVRGLTGTTAGIDLFTNTVAGTDAIKIAHADTSTLNGAQGSAGIASITVDEMGHVTAVTTATYLTSEADTLQTVTDRGATSTNQITLTQSDSGTNTVLYPLVLVRESTGIPANNIGTGIRFVTETSDGNNEIGATIEAVVSDVTAASEDFSLVFKTMAAGATASTALTLTSTGSATIVGDLTVSGGDISAGNVVSTLFGGNSTTATTWGGSLTSGALTIGGTATTGTITFDRSASAHTVNYSTGANASGVTKTVNFATGGAAGSTTNITVGSNGGGTLTVNSPNTTFNQPAAGVFTIQASSAPTTDMTVVTNTGFPVVTAGVNALAVTYVGSASAAGIEASAMRIDLTPGGTPTAGADVWSGLRLTQGAATSTGVTVNVIKADNITAGSGTDNVFYVGTGYDSIINYNGTPIIAGDGSYFQSTSLGSTTAPAFSFTGDPNTGIYSSAADTLNITTGGTLAVTVASNGTVTIVGDLTVSGGDISAGNVASTLFAGNTTTATTWGGALTSGALTIGGTATTGTITFDRSASAHTVNYSTGANASGVTKTVNFATGGAAGSTTNITVGSSGGGTLTVNSPNTTFNQPAAGVFKIQASSAPTTDMVQITNTGQANVTAGVNALAVTYIGGAAAVEASAMRIDLTPGGTTGGTWSGLRLTQGATTATGVTVNVIKADNITAGAGTDNVLYVGTGYDSIINYNGTTVINGSGQIVATQIASGTAGIDISGNAATATTLTTPAMIQGADIGGSVDLNSYTTSGFYHQNVNANAASGTNYPVALAGMLEVLADGLMIYQRYTAYNSGIIYTRSYYNTTWYPWRTEVDSTNYTDYTVTKTGTGASGTWGIGISGNAATVTNGVYTTGDQTIAGNKTFSGNIISTHVWDASTGGGEIYLNGASGNRIDWNTNGVAAPAFTTRSAGTKLVLYPGVAAAAVDYGLGIENSNVWFSTSTTSTGFKWYGGTTVAATLTGAGTFTATGDVCAYSDVNLKENIEVISDPLTKVLKLRGVTFTRKDLDDNKTHMGVIAQEVEEVIPEVVITGDDGIKTVAYGNMVGLLIEAVKELTAQNKELLERVAQLESKLNG